MLMELTFNFKRRIKRPVSRQPRIAREPAPFGAAPVSRIRECRPGRETALAPITATPLAAGAGGLDPPALLRAAARARTAARDPPRRREHVRGPLHDGPARLRRRPHERDHRRLSLAREALRVRSPAHARHHARPLRTARACSSSCASARRARRSRSSTCTARRARSSRPTASSCSWPLTPSSATGRDLAMEERSMRMRIARTARRAALAALAPLPEGLRAGARRDAAAVGRGRAARRRRRDGGRGRAQLVPRARAHGRDRPRQPAHPERRAPRERARGLGGRRRADQRPSEERARPVRRQGRADRHDVGRRHARRSARVRAPGRRRGGARAARRSRRASGSRSRRSTERDARARAVRHARLVPGRDEAAPGSAACSTTLGFSNLGADLQGDERVPGFVEVSHEHLATLRPELVVLVAHGDPDADPRGARIADSRARDRSAGLGRSATRGVHVLSPDLFVANPGSICRAPPRRSSRSPSAPAKPAP